MSEKARELNYKRPRSKRKHRFVWCCSSFLNMRKTKSERQREREGERASQRKRQIVK